MGKPTWRQKEPSGSLLNPCLDQRSHHWRRRPSLVTGGHSSQKEDKSKKWQQRKGIGNQVKPMGIWQLCQIEHQFCAFWLFSKCELSIKDGSIFLLVLYFLSSVLIKISALYKARVLPYGMCKGHQACDPKASFKFWPQYL